MMPELVKVDTPIRWPCNGPPSAIALLGLPSGRYCPRAVQSGGACHCGEPQRSIIGEAVVWPVAQVGYGHPKRIPHAVTIGVGEMP